MCMCVQGPLEAGGVRSPGAGVAGSWEQLLRGCGKQLRSSGRAVAVLSSALSHQSHVLSDGVTGDPDFP